MFEKDIHQTKTKAWQRRQKIKACKWEHMSCWMSDWCQPCRRVTYAMCVINACLEHVERTALLGWVGSNVSAAISSLLFVSIWLLQYGSTCKVVWKKRIIAKRRIRISFWIQFTSKIENMSLSGLYQTVLTCSLQ